MYPSSARFPARPADLKPYRIAPVLLLIPAVLTGCARPEGPTILRPGDPPLFAGMGTHHRRVTTDVPLAQQYFDQGLVWAYAFNHDEAIRSFAEAARLDPNCAMAWWGIALCHGPHINNPIVPEERARAAWDAVQKALAVRDRASPVEQALIDAVARRYSAEPPKDRRPLDEAYAEAMSEVWARFPNDPDVGTLYAESLMDLQPWDMWTREKSPKGRTPEILTVLETVLALHPENPGANHLYIHAVEPSSNPDRANAAADRLRSAVPASGHLVHMPSHIDVLTGRWALAAEQNERAIRADTIYRRNSPRQGFYNLYMIHNHHMLSFAAMMQGRSELAIRAGREVFEMLPPEYLRAHAAFADPYMGALYDALKRFGRWDAILEEPPPPEYLPITTCMWRFSRAVACAAKGQVDRALCEQEAFRAAVRKVPADALMAINPAHKILAIAEHMLTGEIEYRRGNIDASVAALRKGIEIEDDLMYMEPPEWIQPVRHTLGAVLVDAGRWDEAEAVYREDLKKWPENGWSLLGLSQCLRARGDTKNLAGVERRLAAVWDRSDMKIDSSCLCVPGEAQ